MFNLDSLKVILFQAFSKYNIEKIIPVSKIDAYLYPKSNIDLDELKNNISKIEFEIRNKYKILINIKLVEDGELIFPELEGKQNGEI